MGMPCLIIAKTSKEGPYRGFRCQWGSDVEDTGRKLREYYNDLQLIDRLMFVCRYSCFQLPVPSDLLSTNEEIHKSASEDGRAYDEAIGNSMDDILCKDILGDYICIYLYNVDKGRWVVSPAEEYYFLELTDDLTDKDLYGDYDLEKISEFDLRLCVSDRA